jgi:hypothetical protein
VALNHSRNQRDDASHEEKVKEESRVNKTGNLKRYPFPTISHFLNEIEEEFALRE